MDELRLDGEVRRGGGGPDVRRVQEWLTLDGFAVAIDEDFGPATEAAVRRFQQARGLDVDGVVGEATFAALTAPMRAALAAIDPAGRTLGQLTVAYAEQHLAQHPREAGGDNRGPWVRLYMDGHDGHEWRWCAGFACFCLGQAARSLGVAPPFRKSFSCDTLAALAKANGLFLDGDAADVAARVTPGSFFLVRRAGASDEWSHTGLVAAAAADTVATIEGNTNDDGSANGYEVCARTRGYAGKDFILIA